jgi:hypothetical protein
MIAVKGARSAAITMLINPKSPTAEPSIRDAQAEAHAKGGQLST